MRQDIGKLLLTGSMLAAVELLVTLLRGHALFLSWGEALLFGLTALAALASAVLALGLLLRVSDRRARGGPVAELALPFCFALAAGVLLWLLSEGRLVRAVWWRLPAVLSLASGAALGLVALLRALHARRHKGEAAPAMALLVALFAASCPVVSVLVLPRGYPPFHLGLALLATLGMALSGLALPDLPPRAVLRAPWLAVALALLAPLLLRHLVGHPTIGFAVRESAPLSPWLLRPFAPEPRARSAARAARPASGTTAPRRAGVDLRDRDVLLITVDALRADLLRAYGGRGATPALDRLAGESLVFLRAYTPAPHTSYALTSLLTGKYVKPLIELGQKLGDPPTLPDRLRRYGYRTAAFYPPAIFFVDGASFEPLQQRGFGFEYRKEMFASADSRVAQLSEYLAQAEPRPLFIWVHLFEPHEPYDPPSGSSHDGSERGRYEAEVAVCDRAIEQLVRVFRAARPRGTVIVTADHGEEFGDHGGSFHGSTLYDEQVRIPLLWSSPGSVAPRVTHAPVELTDVGTTLLSTAAIPRDPHMRGDDLGALLAGHDDAGPRFAFSSIAQQHMATDGRLKAICAAGAPHCALFDLASDPGEVINLGGARAAEAAALRGEIDLFLATITRGELVAVSEGVALPELLARAKLGAEAEPAQLIGLLAHEQSAVRSESARVLADRRIESAVAALERVRLADDDPLVRSEAAIALVQLGNPAAIEDVLAILRASDDGAEARVRRRRAALALARYQRPEALPELAQLALDEQATESDRLRAVQALGGSGSEQAVEPLIAALTSVRLRPAAASALGQVGGERARRALVSQLEVERYPPARRAEAAALHALGEPRTGELVRRFLGMESSLPSGLALLVERGELATPSRAGSQLSNPVVRAGSWRCAELSCVPEQGARLLLPARGARQRGPLRVVVGYLTTAADASLLINGRRFAVQAAEQQLSFELPAGARADAFSFGREGEVAVTAIALVPSRPELAPPAPEPWQAADGGLNP